MEKKFAHVTELKSTQELIDIYNHATDYQEQFVKEVYDELLARGVDGDKLFRERERYIQEQNKYVELGKKVSILEMIFYPLFVLKFYHTWDKLGEDDGDEYFDPSSAELMFIFLFVALISLGLSARPFHIATAKIARRGEEPIYKYTKGSRIYGWIMTVVGCWALVEVILEAVFP